MIIRGPNENAKRAYQLAFRTNGHLRNSLENNFIIPVHMECTLLEQEVLLLSHRNVPFLLIFLCPTP